MIFVYQTLGLLLGIGLDMVVRTRAARPFTKLLTRTLRLASSLFYPEYPGQNTLRRRGWLLALLLPLSLFLLLSAALVLLYRHAPAAAIAAEGLLLWQTLCVRRSWRETRIIASDLAVPDLYAARLHLSYISQVDTAALDAADTARHAEDAVLRDLRSGLMRPLFYFFFLGSPGAVVSKMTELTAASLDMNTDRYRVFGRAAHRTDSMLRLIPDAVGAYVHRFSAAFVRHGRKNGLVSDPAARVRVAVAAAQFSLLLVVAVSLLLKIGFILILFK